MRTLSYDRTFQYISLQFQWKAANMIYSRIIESTGRTLKALRYKYVSNTPSIQERLLAVAACDLKDRMQVNDR